MQPFNVAFWHECGELQLLADKDMRETHSMRT